MTVTVSIAQAREAINQRWIAAWGSGTTARTPYTFSNESYKPDQTKAWARVTSRHETGGQETMGEEGNRRFLRGGRIFVQFFALIDRSGTTIIDGHAQAAIDAFEGRKFDGVWVTRAIPRELGEEGPWHTMTVEFEFTYETTK